MRYVNLVTTLLTFQEHKRERQLDLLHHTNNYHVDLEMSGCYKVGQAELESGTIYIDHVLAYAISHVFGYHNPAEKAFNKLFTRCSNVNDINTNIIDNDYYKYSYYIYMAQLNYVQYFLCYALFLSNVKSKNACKYFEFCLKRRPFRGCIHFQYAIYLCDVIKDYKLSYFHLKMTKTMYTSLNEVNGDSKYDYGWRYVHHIYTEYMTILFKKLHKYHSCDNVKCNQSCRCVFYCSQKCQKKDWIVKHKNECISRYCNALSKKQIRSLSTAQLICNESLQKYFAMFDNVNL